MLSIMSLMGIARIGCQAEARVLRRHVRFMPPDRGEQAKSPIPGAVATNGIPA
jgi:hypothetical protein